MKLKGTIYAVVGPTASGKSEYAVQLAKKHNGEIILADSRQVYKGLNIGTGKVPGKWLFFKTEKKSIFTYKGIRHHIIDFVSPKRQYTAADFKRDATAALLDILSRGKTPIICGGTGHWIDALLLDQHIPDVPPNEAFRKRMEQKSAVALFTALQKKDPLRAKSIDRYNKRRLIRALEIIRATGKPVPEPNKQLNIGTFKHTDILLSIQWVYLHPPREELYKKIENRLEQRLRLGMIAEAKQLHVKGLSWKRMEDLGLEYRYLSRYLRGIISKQEMQEQLLTEIKHYAKRQETWFKRYRI